MTGENWKPWLGKIGLASISEEDVRRDPAAAFNRCLDTMRAAYLARVAREGKE